MRGLTRIHQLFCCTSCWQVQLPPNGLCYAYTYEYIYTSTCTNVGNTATKTIKKTSLVVTLYSNWSTLPEFDWCPNGVNHIDYGNTALYLADFCCYIDDDDDALHITSFVTKWLWLMWMDSNDKAREAYIYTDIYICDTPGWLVGWFVCLFVYLQYLDKRLCVCQWLTICLSDYMSEFITIHYNE